MLAECTEHDQLHCTMASMLPAKPDSKYNVWVLLGTEVLQPRKFHFVNKFTDKHAWLVFQLDIHTYVVLVLSKNCLGLVDALKSNAMEASASERNF